ncbi:MAG: 2-dehydropantoate 2-reductase [Acidilobaceae archaeon]
MTRVCIKGMGAVGSLLGLFIARASREPVVAIVRRIDHARLLNNEGVRVRGLLEDTYSVRATISHPDTRCDYTIIATKAYDARGAIRESLAYSNTIVPVSNGFGALEEALNNTLNVIGGLVDYGVTRISDNIIEVRGLGKIILGLPRGSRASIKPLADILEKGGANVKIVEDIEPWRWLKAAANAVINPITALTGRENGVVLEDLVKPIVEGIVDEVSRVAQRIGVNMPEDPLAYIYSVAEKTRNNKSSMLVDIEACRRTEIEEINGYIAKLSSIVGVDAKYNRILYTLVKILESNKSHCYK